MCKFRKRNFGHDFFIGLFMRPMSKYTRRESRSGDPILWLILYTENTRKISKYVMWRPCDIKLKNHQRLLGKNRKIPHGIGPLCFLQSSMEMTSTTHCHCFENHSNINIHNFSHGSLSLESVVKWYHNSELINMRNIEGKDMHTWVIKRMYGYVTEHHVTSASLGRQNQGG